MKRFFLLVLVLSVLVSCTGNDLPATPDTTSNIIENSTDFITMSTEDTTAEDTTPVSSVSSSEPNIRYEKQYNVTKITTTSYHTYQYQYKDKFYQSTYRREDGERRVCLTSWNADGSVADVVYYPDPDPDGWNPPFYIFPLSDGRTLMVHEVCIWDQNKEHSHFDLKITLLSADHTVVNQTTVPDDTREIASYMRYAPCVLYENTDGTFSLIFTIRRYIPSTIDHIFDNTLYVYDETLTEVHKIPFSNDVWGKTINRIDDKTYRVGAFINELIKIDTALGISRPHGGFRLPASMLDAVVYGEYTDHVYFQTDDGLYRYQDDKQPKLLIEWSNSPFSSAYMRENGSPIYIIDDTHFFIESQAKLSEGTSTGVFYVEVTEVPSSDRTVIELAQIGLAQNLWLNDMIYQFNQTSTEYKINLTQYPTMSREEGRAQVDSLLLAAHKPDIIFSASGDVLSRHNDKNAYLDLSDALSVRLFGCVDRIHSENGALYQLPLSMTATMFVSPDTVTDQPLTWNKMEQIMQNLGDGELLTSSANASKIILYPNTPMQFVNESNKESSFDSDTFCQAIRLLDEMHDYVDETAGQLTNNFLLTSGAYAVTNGTLHRRLADGGIKLIRFDFNELESYAALKLLFHEIPFTFCGLPTVTGELCADIQTQKMLSVSADTDAKDGCLAFVELLLSDDAQANLGQLEQNLPVTPSAMLKLMDASRYQYYPKEIIHDLIEAPDTGLVYTNWHGVTKEYDLSYGNHAEKADELFYISSFTEEDERRIIDFFDHCTSYRTDDETVMEIVNEELSYWKNDARSLENTGDIINSRVWIYLNE